MTFPENPQGIEAIAQRLAEFKRQHKLEPTAPRPPLTPEERELRREKVGEVIDSIGEQRAKRIKWYESQGDPSSRDLRT